MAGDKIILYIPNIMDTFPDMNGEGWTIDDVNIFASEYNLSVSVTYQETTEYEEGRIISQSRPAGDPIYKGTSLRVEVAKKPEEKKEETPKEEDKDTENKDNADKENSTDKDKETTDNKTN